MQLGGHVPLRGAVDTVIALAVRSDLSGVVKHLFHGLGRSVFIQACALENFLVVGGDVGAEVPRKCGVVLVCAQLGRVPNGLDELVTNTGSLHIEVHEEVGLGQGQDGGGRNVHNVCHLAIGCLSSDGLVEFGATCLISPLDLDTGVSVLKFLDLLGEEVAEVGLEALGLEGDFAFDLRGVDLRIIEIRCGDITGNIGLGDRTRCGSTACRT